MMDGHLEGENLMVVASQPLPFSRENTSENSTQHSQRFIFIKSSAPPHTCSSNQVNEDSTIGYTATDRNKGFHLFIVKEEVAQALSQEHDLVDTRRNTEVKLCKN